MAESREALAVRPPSMADAIIPLAALALLIGSSVALFGLDALDGSIQVALVLCCAVAALIARKNGHHWLAVQEAGRGALSSITSALFILLAVGALIGTLEPVRDHSEPGVLRHSGTVARLLLRRHRCDLWRGGDVDRQLMDNRRNSWCRPRGHRDRAGSVGGDHRRRGDLGGLPR